MHIIGASGHAKVVIDILISADIQISTVWDKNPKIKSILGYRVLSDFEDFKRLSIDEVLIAIGNNKIRKEIATKLHNDFGNAIHPNSSISKSALIGFGTVVMSNASVNSDAVVGNHGIINTNASVDHDCTIDNYVHLSPHVALAGNVEVGEGTHIGIGACVIQGIKIGRWVTIGAGAVVIKNIPDFAVVVGNPARIIKYNSEF